MKTTYIKPESIIINVRLLNSVLDKDDVFGGSRGAGGGGWANEISLETIEEEELLAPQTSLWDE